MLHAAPARDGELPVREDSDCNSTPPGADKCRDQIWRVEGVGRDSHFASCSLHSLDRLSLGLAGLHQVSDGADPMGNRFKVT